MHNVLLSPHTSFLLPNVFPDQLSYQEFEGYICSHRRNNENLSKRVRIMVIKKKSDSTRSIVLELARWYL